MSFASARAMLRAATCAAGAEQMASDASLAVAEEPPWSPWRAMALCLSAEAQLLLGEGEQATALFEESCVVAEMHGNVNASILSRAELAVSAMDAGRWANAAEHLQIALATIDEFRLSDYVLSGLAFAAAARLAAHGGDRAEADRQLARAMRGRPSSTFVLPWVAVRARIQLAKTYAAIADQSTARHLLREIDDVLTRRPALGTLVDEVSELRRTLTSGAQVAAAGGPPLSPAELRLLPYLQTHLTFKQIGERLFVSRNTVSSEVGSIYRKLGVSSRSDAVQQAMTDRPARSLITPGRLFEETSFTSYPSAIARSAPPSPAGKPDDGDEHEQRVDDLGGRRTRTLRGVHLRSVVSEPPTATRAPIRTRACVFGSSFRESSTTPLTQASAKCSSLMASRRRTSR